MSSVLTEWAVARRALARKAALSVVGIDRGQGVRLSGIVWDSETLVTAAEILHGADTVTVQTDNEAVPAEILACDLSVDVAVLRARTGASGVSTTNSAGLAAGDDVLVAGRSHTGSALLWTHVEQVGPAWRSRSGGALDRLIRLSPGLHPTLEGGGIFDLEGRLCAMAVRGPRHQTIGIPSETIGRILSTVREHGRLPQPYLGIRLQPVGLDESLRQQLSRDSSNGAIVVGVEPESPAAAAGLLFGDLIVSVAGQPIHNAIDLKIALSEMALGSPVEVQVYRAGASLELTVSVRERARY